LKRGHNLNITELKQQGWNFEGHLHPNWKNKYAIVSRVHNQGKHISTWPGVHWVEEQVKQIRVKRDALTLGEQLASEPLYNSQWHLHYVDFDESVTSPSDLNVEPVWIAGNLGQGAQLAIVDDGVEKAHPDLAANFVAEDSYSVINANNVETPSFDPITSDGHGTRSAGTAAAGINGICGAGSAPRARLAGIRLLDTSQTAEMEAASLTWHDQKNMIYSSSWGPTDDGLRTEGPSQLLADAMEEAITNGRNGRGVIYVWAGGNGKRANDNCNKDGYVNSRYTIAVAAIDHHGVQAPYSEECSALLVNAPGGFGRLIPTTTLTKEGQCTASFSGTSASCPMVAGVVALILTANPNLSWRDVQGVFVRSSDKNDPGDASWNLNGAGLLFSHKYGFGKVNAARAVSLAKAWAPLSSEQHISSGTMYLPVNGTSPKNASYSVTLSLKVESVAVKLVCLISNRGRLSLNLYSPSGMKSSLIGFHDDTTKNYVWTFTSMAHYGEDSIGVWTLEFIPDANRPDLRILDTTWELSIYGHLVDEAMV